MTTCEAPSLSRYKDARTRCRCDGCVAANADYMREYHVRRVLSGSVQLIDAGRCRQALVDLHRQGLSYRQVADLAGHGITTMQVYRLATGRTQRCRRGVARALLAVTTIDVR